MRPLMKTPAKGADTVIYLASSPDVEGVTGRFFVNRKPRKSNKASYDTAIAARLWQLSERRQYVLDSDWGQVQPSAEAQNAYLKSHSWDDYALWHLGLTDGATD